MAEHTEAAKEDVTNRRRQLRAWIDQFYGGNQSRFVEDRNLNQSEISGLLRVKSFGSVKARKLEQQAGMPARYLEARPTVLADGNDPLKHVELPGHVAGNKSLQYVPLLHFTELETILLPNDDWRFAMQQRIAAMPDTGRRAKGLIVADDSMREAGLTPGDIATLDPDVSPEAGDIVLVRDHLGGHYLREYRVRAAGQFEAAARNPVHRSFHSGEDRLTVLAVATHVTKALRRSGRSESDRK